MVHDLAALKYRLTWAVPVLMNVKQCKWDVNVELLGMGAAYAISTKPEVAELRCLSCSSQ